MYYGRRCSDRRHREGVKRVEHYHIHGIEKTLYKVDKNKGDAVYNYGPENSGVVHIDVLDLQDDRHLSTDELYHIETI